MKPTLEHYLKAHIAKGHSNFRLGLHVEKDGEPIFLLHSQDGDSISVDLQVTGDTVTFLNEFEDDTKTWIADKRVPEQNCIRCGRVGSDRLFCKTCTKSEPYCSTCGEHAFRGCRTMGKGKEYWCEVCIEAGLAPEK